jgi:hypothetical protein
MPLSARSGRNMARKVPSVDTKRTLQMVFMTSDSEEKAQVTICVMSPCNTD